MSILIPILVFALCVFLGTYMMTKLTTRQQYRRELWEAVARMEDTNTSVTAFKQRVINMIILSALKD